jgi:LacI family transcriptional regulator
MNCAQERDWRILTVDKPNLDRVDSLIDLWHPRGVIIEGGHGENHFPAPLFRHLPVVYIDREHKASPRTNDRVGYVEHDPNSTAKIAAKELLSLDCAAYAFIPNFIPMSWSRNREAAFREILSLHSKSLLSFPSISKSDDMARWHKDLRDFLKRMPKPCGVFAANDYVGESVLVACADIGLSVPDEVAVVGVDDYATICENTIPTLSSVALDFIGAGRLSVELIEKLIHSESPAFEVCTFGVTGFTRRASSRRLRRNYPEVVRALELIRTKSCEGLSAEQVLSEMKCSRRLAEMRFRSATGHSPLEEIQTRRLERACELLASTDSSVEAVANMCGYGSAVFLQKLFQRHMGVTPREWRAQNRPR